MNTINLINFVRFYPYESVHASSPLIKIEDKDKIWYNAISSLLKRYIADDYCGCPKDYFALRMDNKITLELENETFGRANTVYITYSDNNVYISNAIHTVNTRTYSCTVKPI